MQYGLFGEEQGSSFINKMNEGKIVGFHGREGFSIGVHLMEGKVVEVVKDYPFDAITPTKADVAETVNAPWPKKR